MVQTIYIYLEILIIVVNGFEDQNLYYFDAASKQQCIK